jgi:hypothetical protein
LASAVSSFPVSIAENAMTVDVAGHDVGFDHSRNLWYCDIMVTDSGGHDLKSYYPFIRMALARYQPNSITDCELSKVVLADFAQLTPSRFLTVVTQSTNVRLVTVAGRGYVPPDSPGPTPYIPPIVQVTVQERIPSIPDDALAWRTAQGTGFNPIVRLVPTTSDGNYITWQSRVNLPRNNPLPLRLLIEEFEGHSRSSEHASPTHRLVYTDTFPVTTTVTG